MTSRRSIIRIAGSWGSLFSSSNSTLRWHWLRLKWRRWCILFATNVGLSWFKVCDLDGAEPEETDPFLGAACRRRRRGWQAQQQMVSARRHSQIHGDAAVRAQRLQRGADDDKCQRINWYQRRQWWTKRGTQRQFDPARANRQYCWTEHGQTAWAGAVTLSLAVKGRQRFTQQEQP